MSRRRFLLVGLGNPGRKYENTRHNIGFSWIDALFYEWNPGQNFQERFQSHWAQLDHLDWEVHFLKPQTYMNLSGDALRAWRSKYQGEFEICVFVDDIDLPLGKLRLRQKGGDGGHRGLRSLSECFGHENYPRLRIGVGRAEGRDASDMVLEKFPEEDLKVTDKLLKAAPTLTDFLLKDSFAIAMNHINSFQLEDV